MPAPEWFCPLPLDCSETYGELTINNVSLHGPAWCAFDLSPLYDSPEFRGDNVLVETLAGRIAKPTLTDETTYSLRLMLSGYSDQAGTPWAAPAGGLLANRRAFEAAFITPIRTGTADLPATLLVPDPNDVALGITFVFDVQPLKLTGWTLLPNAYARATVELRVPRPDELLDEGEGGE
jgi:hypothetical protein